jgi:hypothetical protein
MPRFLAALSAALLLSAPALADLDPGQVGQIKDEQKAAVDKVHAAHGNKAEKDMSPEERTQQAQEENQASVGVLDKHGVSDKEFSRYSSQMDRSSQAAAKAAEKDAAQKREAKAAEKAKPAAPGEVQIERGEKVSSTENGVEVERGTPAGAGAGVSAPKASSHSSHSSRSKKHRHRR